LAIIGLVHSSLLAVGLALWSAAAMTFGDWIWSALALRHRPQYGLAHGTLLCLWMGLYLGLLARRLARGVAGGAAVGFLAAGSFYALAPVMGYSAMFASWIFLWMALVALAARLLRARVSPSGWVMRALVAAMGSAAAFYAISGIWMGASGTPNYAWHFVAWTIAFLPGSLAMLWKTGTRRTDDQLNA
jgi:hypothetical protein